MAGIAFSTIVADCKLMKTALDSLVQEMPHLAPEHTDLDGFLNEVDTLNARQQQLTGELRQTVRQRKEAQRRGTDLRSRVAAQLRGKLGFTNEQLLKFGVPPRRKVVRRKKGATNGQTPEPSPPATTAPTPSPTPETKSPKT
jgi:hypothetical protein